MDDKIKKMGRYFAGFDIVNDYDGNNNIIDSFKVLKLNIPSDWDVYDVERENYAITPSNQNMPIGVCAFYGHGDVQFSDMCDHAIEIIKHNNDKQEKKILFDKTVLELSDLFNKTNIDKLKTIKFVFEKKPTRGKNIESNQ